MTEIKFANGYEFVWGQEPRQLFLTLDKTDKTTWSLEHLFSDAYIEEERKKTNLQFRKDLKDALLMGVATVWVLGITFIAMVAMIRGF